jgi:exonuclease III
LIFSNICLPSIENKAQLYHTTVLFAFVLWIYDIYVCGRISYMKIATYNVRNLYDSGTFVDSETTEPVNERFFNERIAYFIEKLKALDLDIICLQEIGGEKGVALIAEALSCNFFLARPNKRGIRMGVIYKKTLEAMVSCQSLSFGDLSIPSIQERGDTEMLQPVKQSRDILEITCRTPKVILSINTFHLKSNLPQYLEGDDMEHDSDAYVDAKFRCVFYKIMELRAIRKHVTSRLKAGSEVILLGDYNENNTASLMDILKGSQEETLRLNDIMASYKDSPVTHYHRGVGYTFDTLLISEGLKDKVRSVHVENGDLEDCSQLPLDAEVVGSDHALVFGEFEIN